MTEQALEASVYKFSRNSSYEAGWKVRDPDLLLPWDSSAPGAGSVSFHTQRQLLLKTCFVSALLLLPVLWGPGLTAHGSQAPGIALPSWLPPQLLWEVPHPRVWLQAGDCEPQQDVPLTPELGKLVGLAGSQFGRKKTRPHHPLPSLHATRSSHLGQRKSGLGCRPGWLIAEHRDPAPLRSEGPQDSRAALEWTLLQWKSLQHNGGGGGSPAVGYSSLCCLTRPWV